MITWLFRAVVGGVFICCAALSLGAQDLKILCEVEGRSLALGGVDEKGRVLVVDEGKLVHAPWPALWRVEGDVRAQREWLAWSPPYDFSRLMEQELETHPGSFYRANVRFQGVPHPAAYVAPNQPVITSRWPRVGRAKGVVVSCWVVDGKVVAANVEGSADLEAGMRGTDVFFSADFSKGQAAALLWSEGRIEKPTSLFEDPAVDAAVSAALLDDDASGLVSLTQTRPEVGRLTARDGRPLISIVAEAGAINSVKVLVTTDARLRRELPKDKKTPLQVAAEKGREPVVKELLAAKFEKDAQAADTTALILAATGGHTGAVRLLIEAGADADWETSDQRNVFTQAGDRGFVDILDIVLPKVSWKFRDTPENQSVLCTQASKGHAEMVRWMLGKKVSPNTKLPGFSALGRAALAGRTETVKALIEGKADVKWVDPKSGYTALMLAAGMGHSECVKVLIEAGAEVSATSGGKATALHMAAQADAEAVIDLLLAHGADIDGRTHAGFAPLEIALIGQNPKSVAALEKAGARLDLKSKYAAQAIEAALTMDCDQLLARAIADGWSARTLLQNDWPALRVAKFLGAEKCADLLIKSGADESAVGPYPVLRSKDLDAPLRLTQVLPPSDPRPAGEVFDAQVVLLEAMVTTDGRLLFPKIVQTPEKRLGMAVVDVVSAWRLSPVTKGGAPAAARIRLPVEFSASEVRTFNLKDLDELPKPLKQVRPEYPFGSLVKGQEARVILQFTVGKDGAVKDVRVIEHTGVAFIEPAVKALTQWVFTSGKVAGKAVATKMQVPIIFNLEN
jgi:TonB family protein